MFKELCHVARCSEHKLKYKNRTVMFVTLIQDVWLSFTAMVPEASAYTNNSYPNRLQPFFTLQLSVL
jgi:hypothetical protein